MTLLHAADRPDLAEDDMGPVNGAAPAELTESEALLLLPTASNVEQAAAKLAALVDRARREESCRAALAQERHRLVRLGELLESAWQVRMGLERFAAAGRAGYRADGRLEEGNFGDSTMPGKTASVTG